MSTGLFLLLLVAGALGAIARTSLGQRFNRLIALGTLVANVTACLVLGAASGWLEAGHWQGEEIWNDPAAIALQIGLLGSLSTWSSLANDIATHIRAKQTSEALISLGLNLVLGIGAAWIGLSVAHAFG